MIKIFRDERFLILKENEIIIINNNNNNNNNKKEKIVEFRNIFCFLGFCHMTVYVAL